jgi:hypothetical protein
VHRCSAPQPLRPGTPPARRYRPEPAAKIRRSKYKSRIRGTTNTRPHQRPVAHSTTTTTAIQTASSSRITSDDLRCRRSQLIVAAEYAQGTSVERWPVRGGGCQPAAPSAAAQPCAGGSASATRTRSPRQAGVSSGPRSTSRHGKGSAGDRMRGFCGRVRRPVRSRPGASARPPAQLTQAARARPVERRSSTVASVCERSACSWLGDR